MKGDGMGKLTVERNYASNRGTSYKAQRCGCHGPILTSLPPGSTQTPKFQKLASVESSAFQRARETQELCFAAENAFATTRDHTQS